MQGPSAPPSPTKSTKKANIFPVVRIRIWLRNLFSILVMIAAFKPLRHVMTAGFRVPLSNKKRILVKWEIRCLRSCDGPPGDSCPSPWHHCWRGRRCLPTWRARSQLRTYLDPRPTCHCTRSWKAALSAKQVSTCQILRAEIQSSIKISNVRSALWNSNDAFCVSGF